MPKIIKNLEKRLVEEARQQIEKNGYGGMTMRSVAEACDVGVGTVYNYFSSKDELLATYMLGDWNRCIDAINAVSKYSDSPAPVLRCIYDQLLGYAAAHQGILRDKSAASAFAATFSRFHKILRQQLAIPLSKFCDNEFCAEFIAEAMLAWSLEGKDFDGIYAVIEKLFKDRN